MAQGTAFVYQGRLSDNGVPANGNYDLRFTAYDAVTNGNPASDSLTNANVTISNGLFSVNLDFGPGVFNGAERWLELGVRTNGSASDYVLLSPRQHILAVPYAITAGHLTGSVADSQLSGNIPRLNSSQSFTGTVTASSFTGSGDGLTNLNAVARTGDTMSGTLNVNGGLATSSGDLIVNSATRKIGMGTSGPLFAFDLMAPSGVDVGLLHAGIDGGADGANGFNIFKGQFDELYYSFNSGPNGPLGFYQDSQGKVGIGKNSPVTALDVNGTVTAAAFAGSGSQALDFTVDNARALRLEPNAVSPNVIGGWFGNSVYPGLNGVTISGGGQSGNTNQAAAGADNSVIGGGWANTVSAGTATIGGGALNTASGQYSTVPGGVANTAGGFTSFAVGRQAKAIHDGTFVWGDSAAVDFASTGNDQFLIRAAGGVGIGINAPTAPLHVSGYDPNGTTAKFERGVKGEKKLWLRAIAGERVIFASDGAFAFNTASDAGQGSEWLRIATNGFVGIGTNNPAARLQVVNATCDGTTWNNASDRSLKENFKKLNNREVLARVADLPISRWNYKARPQESHIGPMAQDFVGSFGVGADDKHIATVDAEGVAFAAIQGLNEKLEEKEAAIQQLEQRLQKLEQLLQEKTKGQ